jgi:hypothetical protein
MFARLQFAHHMRNLTSGFYLSLAALIALGSGSEATAQTISSAAVQQPVVVGSIAAFNRSGPFQTITLLGSAVRGTGPSQISGTVRFVAKSDGSGSTQINFGSFVDNEVFPPSASPITCANSFHSAPLTQLAPGHCLMSTLWFLPQIAVSMAPADPNLLSESPANGLTGITLYRPRQPQLGFTVQQTKALSLSTLLIDPTTMLITQNNFAISFDQRPSLAIPITVFYSEYFTSHGITVPGHIQRFIHGALQLDVHITSIEVAQ